MCYTAEIFLIKLHDYFCSPASKPFRKQRGSVYYSQILVVITLESLLYYFSARISVKADDLERGVGH